MLFFSYAVLHVKFFLFKSLIQLLSFDATLSRWQGHLILVSALIDTPFEMPLSPFHLFKSSPVRVISWPLSTWVVSRWPAAVTGFSALVLANAALIILTHQHNVYPVSLELSGNI